VGRRRGRLTMSCDRENIINLISEAQDGGARQSKACAVIGISAKTLQRWVGAENTQDGRLEPSHTPKNKLTELERQRILRICNEPEYANLPPNKVVPKLADKGTYLASEATIYRILKQNKQLNHRLKSKPNKEIIKPKALVATSPNQIYSWDITYLPTAVRGVFYYLYLVMDIYSRKIVGWQIHECENSGFAADLMKDICLRENIQRNQVTLHSDNGSPMKGATMLATLQELGVMPSFSRPSVSNDNPYSERLFRTLKYCPEYPGGAFVDLIETRLWVSNFVQWYNHEHLHSSIQYVTPAQRHAGHDQAILTQRKAVYFAAKQKHPERWSGNTRCWAFIPKVLLNPEKEKSQKEHNQAA